MASLAFCVVSQTVAEFFSRCDCSLSGTGSLCVLGVFLGVNASLASLAVWDLSQIEVVAPEKRSGEQLNISRLSLGSSSFRVLGSALINRRARVGQVKCF